MLTIRREEDRRRVRNNRDDQFKLYFLFLPPYIEPYERNVRVIFGAHRSNSISIGPQNFRHTVWTMFIGTRNDADPRLRFNEIYVYVMK